MDNHRAIQLAFQGAADLALVREWIREKGGGILHELIWLSNPRADPDMLQVEVFNPNDTHKAAAWIRHRKEPT
jgi:hypothetical protein